MLVERKSFELMYLLTAEFKEVRPILKLTVDALGLVHHELLLDLVTTGLELLLAGLTHHIIGTEIFLGIFRL